MKEKIEVEMYVRFRKRKETYIRKLLEVIHNFETFDVYRTDKEYFDYEEKDYFDIVYPNEIIKASYDITDVIEKDDVIAYYNKLQDVKGLIIERVQDNGYIKKLKEFVKIGTIDIVRIMTKEYFEYGSYKIGE